MNLFQSFCLCCWLAFSSGGYAQNDEIARLKKELAELRAENMTLKEELAKLRAVDKEFLTDFLYVREKASLFLQGVVEDNPGVYKLLTNTQQRVNNLTLASGEGREAEEGRQKRFRKVFLPEGKYKRFTITAETVSPTQSEILIRGVLNNDGGERGFTMTMYREGKSWGVHAFQIAKQ